MTSAVCICDVIKVTVSVALDAFWFKFLILPIDRCGIILVFYISVLYHLNETYEVSYFILYKDIKKGRFFILHVIYFYFPIYVSSSMANYISKYDELRKANRLRVTHSNNFCFCKLHRVLMRLLYEYLSDCWIGFYAKNRTIIYFTRI